MTDIASAPAASAPAVVFDLDGTLVDPAGAITGGIADALRAHDIEVPSRKILDATVGPPLATALKSVPGLDEERIPSIISRYRTAYWDKGMAESQLYPGIHDLLVWLGENGVRCAVATSKPQPMAERLLAIQDVAGFFEAVHGADIDEAVPHAGKGPIVAAALGSLGMSGMSHSQRREQAVMVGDRIFDVDGAHANGLRCIGVRWGYAPENELEDAGAAAVVATAGELGHEIAGALKLAALPFAGGHALTTDKPEEFHHTVTSLMRRSGTDTP